MLNIHFHWLLRILLILILTYFYFSSYSIVEQCKSYSLYVFGDTSWHRMNGRMDSLLCGILSCTLGVWLVWYRICIVMSFAPLVLIEIEKYTGQYSDKNALKYIRNFLLWISVLQLLYLVWFSWFQFFFSFFLFFSKICSFNSFCIFFMFIISCTNLSYNPVLNHYMEFTCDFSLAFIYFITGNECMGFF